MASRSGTAAPRQDDQGRSRFERRNALLALAVALVGVPFGLLLHQVVVDGPLAALDERFARSLHDRLVDEPALVSVVRVISALGSAAVLVPLVGAAAIWLWRSSHRRLAVFLATVSLGGALVGTLVKLAVGRPRPALDEPFASAFGNSFPSGHSMSSVVCFGALLVVFLPFASRRWRAAASAGTVLLVLAIGASRLVLGVHFVSDVLGGYVLGAAWLAGSVAAFQTWREERGRRRTRVLEEGLEPEVS